MPWCRRFIFIRANGMRDRPEFLKGRSNREVATRLTPGLRWRAGTGCTAGPLKQSSKALLEGDVAASLETVRELYEEKMQWQ